MNNNDLLWYLKLPKVNDQILHLSIYFNFFIEKIFWKYESQSRHQITSTAVWWISIIHPSKFKDGKPDMLTLTRRSKMIAISIVRGICHTTFVRNNHSKRFSFPWSDWTEHQRIFQKKSFNLDIATSEFRFPILYWRAAWSQLQQRIHHWFKDIFHTSFKVFPTLVLNYFLQMITVLFHETTNLRKLNIIFGLVPYTVKDTRVFLLEMANPIVSPRTNSISFRKFPTPYLSTLEEPSIRKARSILALQADRMLMQHNAG